VALARSLASGATELTAPLVDGGPTRVGPREVRLGTTAACSTAGCSTAGCSPGGLLVVGGLADSVMVGDGFSADGAALGDATSVGSSEGSASATRAAWSPVAAEVATGGAAGAAVASTMINPPDAATNEQARSSTRRWLGARGATWPMPGERATGRASDVRRRTPARRGRPTVGPAS